MYVVFSYVSLFPHPIFISLFMFVLAENCAHICRASSESGKKLGGLFFGLTLKFLSLPTHYYIYYTFRMMDMEKKNGGNGELQIELKEEVGLGTYANLAVITHSSSEFVLDFVSVLPGIPKAPVQSRIILAPEHAKRLLNALEDNISKYEHAFGPISMPEERALTFPNVAGEA